MATFKFSFHDSEHHTEDLSYNDTSILFEIRNNDAPTIHALLEHFEYFLLATGYGELLKGKYIDLVDRLVDR